MRSHGLKERGGRFPGWGNGFVAFLVFRLRSYLLHLDEEAAMGSVHPTGLHCGGTWFPPGYPRSHRHRHRSRPSPIILYPPFGWGRNIMGLDWEGEMEDTEEEGGDMAGYWVKGKTEVRWLRKRKRSGKKSQVPK